MKLIETKASPVTGTKFFYVRVGSETLMLSQSANGAFARRVYNDGRRIKDFGERADIIKFLRDSGEVAQVGKFKYVAAAQ